MPTWYVINKLTCSSCRLSDHSFFVSRQQGDYWSFTLAGSFLPIVLLRNNIGSGIDVTETYRQYIYIYLPGIIGAIFAVFSVQLPLIGRKWSLVISALLQGVSMAMYTQVRNTAGYVGLNALEYIMQTVRIRALFAIGLILFLFFFCFFFTFYCFALSDCRWPSRRLTGRFSSTSTPCFTLQHPRSSIRLIEPAQAACSRAWGALRVLSHPLPANRSLRREHQVCCGWEPAGSGSPQC